MNLDVLTPAQKRVYEVVQKYREKNPDASNHAALKANGLITSTSTYSAALKRLKGVTRKPYTRKSKMITIIPEQRTSHVVAFVGDSDSVVSSVQKFMRGDS